jgi:hypothetical protein
MADSTYFFHCEDVPEAEIARLYVESMYPGTGALIVSELLIPRLTERNHVVVLSRPQKVRYPTSRQWKAENGQRLDEPVPADKLLHSVKESPIIAVATFIQGASRYSIGRFDSNRFFDEVGKYISGSLRGQHAEGTMRYLSA